MADSASSVDMEAHSKETKTQLVLGLFHTNTDNFGNRVLKKKKRNLRPDESCSTISEIISVHTNKTENACQMAIHVCTYVNSIVLVGFYLTIKLSCVDSLYVCSSTGMSVQWPSRCAKVLAKTSA